MSRRRTQDAVVLEKFGASSEPEPKPRPPKDQPAVVGPFMVSGLCRTEKGWAVAIVEVGTDGQTISVEVGPSQQFPEIVAQQLVRKQMALNQDTLRRYPWKPG